MVLGVGKGVLFREVSSVQRCPYRGVPKPLLYCMKYDVVNTATHTGSERVESSVVNRVLLCNAALSFNVHAMYMLCVMLYIPLL